MKEVLDAKRNIRIEIEKLSDRPFYAMKYYGDDRYYQYLKQGARSLDEYCALVDTMLFADEEKKFKYDSFGCSAFLAKDENGDFLYARNMDCENAILLRQCTFLLQMRQEMQR